MLEFLYLNCVWLNCEDEEGATAIEYGLIAALVSFAGLVSLGAVGEQVQSLYSLLTTAMQTP